MKMVLPGLRERRRIDKLLTSFFAEYKAGDFRRAMVGLSRFYHLPMPRVVWFEYLDWGKSGGRTYEDGKIHLVHPENWKRGRKYNSMRRWINTVYHEMGHFIFWVDAERKADTRSADRIAGPATPTAPAERTHCRRPRSAAILPRTTPHAEHEERARLHQVVGRPAAART